LVLLKKKNYLFPVLHFSLVRQCNLFGCTFYMVLREQQFHLTDPKSFIPFVLFATHKAIPFWILLLKATVLLVFTYFIFPSYFISHDFIGSRGLSWIPSAP
jgi:hypothetical protein